MFVGVGLRSALFFSLPSSLLVPLLSFSALSSALSAVQIEASQTKNITQEREIYNVCCVYVCTYSLHKRYVQTCTYSAQYQVQCTMYIVALHTLYLSTRYHVLCTMYIVLVPCTRYYVQGTMYIVPCTSTMCDGGVVGKSG